MDLTVSRKKKSSTSQTSEPAKKTPRNNARASTSASSAALSVNESSEEKFVPMLPRKLKQKANVTMAVLDSNFDKSILKRYICAAFKETSMQTEKKSLPVPYSILWCTGIGFSNSHKLEHLADRQYCNLAVVVFTWQQYVYKIGTNSLLTYLTDVKTAYANKKIIVIVYNMKDYFDFFEDQSARSRPLDLSLGDSEYHLVPQQQRETVQNLDIKIKFEFQIHVLHTERGNSCRELIFAINENIVDSDKFEHEKFFENCRTVGMLRDVDNSRVTVSDNGLGLLEVWRLQMQRLEGATVAKVDAIVNRYESLQKLLKAYDEFENADKMLTDIPEIDLRFSKTVYNFYNTLDKNLFLCT